MTIVFQKTNVYDSNTLCSTMILITKWINHIEKMNQPFPSNFDFTFFLKGLNISLEIDHHVSKSRVLWFLYKTLHYFPLEQKIIIVQELLRKYFYDFFFNWSYTVRDLFMALLLY